MENCKMKKNLKRLLIVLFAVIISVTAASCGSSGKGSETTGAAPVMQSTAEAAQTENADDESTTPQTKDETDAETSSETAAETASTWETAAETSTETTAPSGPVYYTFDDIDALENTENFSKKAIEHIFNGTINSNGNGSGYHYDMVEGSDGVIIEGTRSKEDKNGLYTAYIEVDGHKKSHYSTFFPDSWSPQQVVDAINEAMEDALDNDRHNGDTWIGYYEDIEINMFFDTKGRIVSAYPIFEDDKR